MRTFPLACLTAFALADPAFGQQSITQADLLRRITDLDRLTTPPPVGERTGMCSSYDRASRIDEHGNYVNWDANQDWGQFIRKDPDGWDVMAELKGAGALTRIWSANPQGAIRFVLDGQVVIDTTFAELMSGHVAPFNEPFVYRGLNCYFPLGFSQSCKVVCRDSQAYYQINYVLFPPGTQVERFKFALDDAAQAALAEVRQTLQRGVADKQLFHGRRMLPVAIQEDLKPDKKMGDALDGTGVVRALYVALTDRTNPTEAYALHHCILRVFVDGEKQPSVEAPLIDFFGPGFDVILFDSLVIGTNRAPPFEIPGRRLGEDRMMYCFFPMPYRNGLRVEIENLNTNKKAIGLMLYVQADTQELPPADALRFYARFRKEDPCQVLDYPILETSGRGRIVGCVLDVDCPRAEWWGEGDDKVWLDGEKFPSYFGTGSEDYLGDAWGLHPHVRALQGATRVSPYGKSSAYRWHIPDCINFQKSVRFTIENWQHRKAKDTYYGTVAYWYGEPGAKSFFKPLKSADLDTPGLRIPGAVEIESSISSANWGTVVKEEFAGSELSGGQAANITSGKPVEVNIHVDAARTARLKLRVNPRRPFETITVKDAGGRTVGTLTYSREVPDGIYTVGVIRLEKGNNTVTVQCSKSAMLDCWVLEPVPKNRRGPEGEDLKVVAAGKAQVQVEYATLDWSGGAQLALNFAAVGDTVTLALPERKADAVVTVRLHVTPGPAGGRFQTLLDDQPLGDPFDCYAEPPTIRRVALGVATLKAGAHTLAFRALEPEAKSKGQQLGLDVVELPKALSPYALECEDLPVGGSDRSNHEVQPIDGASGEEHMWCRATEAGAWIEFGVPVRQAGQYRVSVVYTKSFDYGILQAYVNGQKAGKPVDTFAQQIVPGLVVELGTFDLPAEPLRIKVELTGKSDQSPGYYFGVDGVILEPAK